MIAAAFLGVLLSCSHSSGSDGTPAAVDYFITDPVCGEWLSGEIYTDQPGYTEIECESLTENIGFIQRHTGNHLVWQFMMPFQETMLCHIFTRYDDVRGKVFYTIWSD